MAWHRSSGMEFQERFRSGLNWSTQEEKHGEAIESSQPMRLPERVVCGIEQAGIEEAPLARDKDFVAT